MIDVDDGPSDFGRALDLLAQLVDPDDCWFDHNGDCQAHGFTLVDGEICPNAEARTLLRGYR